MKQTHKKIEIFLTVVLLMSLAVVIAFIAGFYQKRVVDYLQIPPEIYYIFLLFLLAALMLIFVRLKPSLSKDEVQRASAAEIDQLEKRLLSDIKTYITNTFQDKFSKDNIIKDILSEKMNDEFINTLGEALRNRTASESKPLRILSNIRSSTNELKIRLEGAGGREERKGFNARTSAYLMALLGVMFATMRLYQLLISRNESLPASTEVAYDISLWPYIFAGAAPWVAAIFVCEFTALVFFRDSNRSNERQRYYTEMYSELRDRHMALEIIIEYGTPEEIVASARSMIVYNAHKFEEFKEAETISATTNFVESVTGLIKETTGKFGPK